MTVRAALAGRPARSPLGPAQVAARLAAVPLYQNPATDPVLGPTSGLTVASDAIT